MILKSWRVKTMKRNRAKLYPERMDIIIPEDLNNFLGEYKTSTGMNENIIIRNLINELDNGEIDLKELQKYCY